MTITFKRPYEDCRVYNLRIELSEDWHEWNRGHGKPHGPSEIFAPIRGIQALYCSGYELTIVKGSAFTWDEIEPEVLRVLENANGLDEIK